MGIFAALFAVIALVLLIERPGCGPLTNTTRRVSGQIVDETGQPVPDVRVDLKWSVGLGLSSGSSHEHAETLTSDAQGRFSGRGGSHYFGLTAEKEGYYPSWLSAGEALRTEALSILLKRVRYPQPMVGKKVDILLPPGSYRFEYDLLAGDCLPPHGSGTRADLVVEWSKPDPANGVYPRDVISVRFPGDGNGVLSQQERVNSLKIVSRLRSTHEAPESGYVPSLGEADRVAGGDSVSEKIYCFKVRSGLPPGALFGKIRGDFLYIAERSGDDRFNFQYVINPSGDRGLEFEKKQVTMPTRHALEYLPEEF